MLVFILEFFLGNDSLNLFTSLSLDSLASYDNITIGSLPLPPGSSASETCKQSVACCAMDTSSQRCCCFHAVPLEKFRIDFFYFNFENLENYSTSIQMSFSGPAQGYMAHVAIFQLAPPPPPRLPYKKKIVLWTFVVNFQYLFTI